MARRARADLLADHLELPEEGLGAFHKDFASVGQADALAGANQQGGANLLFQMGQQAREGGLGDPQFGRRLVDAAQLGDPQKDFDPPRVHVAPLVIHKQNNC